MRPFAKSSMPPDSCLFSPAEKVAVDIEIVSVCLSVLPGKNQNVSFIVDV
jgi:hypothetical protein